MSIFSQPLNFYCYFYKHDQTSLLCFFFQLFDKILAPSNMRDDGCDNMTCIIVKPLHGGVVSKCSENDAEIHVSDAEVPSHANIEANTDELSGKVAETANEQNDKCENLAENDPNTVTLALAEVQGASEKTVPDLQDDEKRLKTDDINLEKDSSISEVV